MKNLKIDKLEGTEFQKKVWSALTRIPRGQTITYKELAEHIGLPKAVRAVANAVGKNPLPPHIPCHRVIRSDGRLGGYSGRGGTREKLRLLKNEGLTFSNKMIK